MSSRGALSLRPRRAVIPVVTLVLATVAGCAGPPESAAPPISAAASAVSRELAVSDLLPPFDWPGPETISASAAVPPPPGSEAAVVPATIPAPEAPVTTAAEEASLVGDPRGVEAMALITFPWRRTLPGWSIAFLPARVGLLGLTRVDDRRIEVYLRDGDSATSLARVVAHELGHAVDVVLNSPSDRDRWRTTRGVGASVSWWPGNAVSDFDTLAGDFAEAFATMLTGSVSLSRVAPAPGPAELAVLAELAVP